MTDPVTTTLEDSAARERAALPGRNVALTAGAGAGKTSVLVARLVAQLEGGAAPSQIAAITFTERAAAELEARTRDALHARRVALASDARLRARLDDALAKLDQLTLSTIHAFCLDLLERESLEAGWAPGVTIAAGDDSLFEQVYASWREGFERRHPTLATRARAEINEDSVYGSASMREAARLLVSHRDLRPRVSDAPPDWAALRAAITAPLDALRLALPQCLTPQTCKAALLIQPLLASADAIDPGADDAAQVRALVTLPACKIGRSGRASDWQSGALNSARAAASELQEAIKSAQQAIGEGLHAQVVSDLREHFLPALAHARREAGVASFDDLLFEALALLERDAPRARLSARYPHLLIDEVQDTDPIQAEVALRLTQRGPGQPPAPGRLFAVGDPAQSIYRFRRADVATWGALVESIGRSGESLALTTNFRSVPGLVGWFNEAFSAMPSHRAQRARREASAHLEPLVVISPDEADAQAQADLLARHLRALWDGGAQVIEPETQRPRPMRWDDVMILLPSWTRAELVRMALWRAGVDAVVEGGATLFGREESRLMMAALRALCEPGDARAAAFALRGLFGVTWAQLAESVRTPDDWRALHQAQAPELRQGALALRELGAKLATQPLWQVWRALLERSQAPAVWALRARGAVMLENIATLEATLRELEREAPTPMAALRALEALAHSGQAERTSAAGMARITTIYQAKGLEAPIVALPLMTRRMPPVQRVADRAACEVAVRLAKAVAPPGWEALEADEKEAMRQERRRLLYVAATRARDHLVIVRQRGDKDLWAEAELTHALEGGFAQVVRHTDGAALAQAPAREGGFRVASAQLDAALAGPALDEEAAQRAYQCDMAIHRARAASHRWRPLRRAARGLSGDAQVDAIARAALLGALSDSQQSAQTRAQALCAARALDDARCARVLEVVAWVEARALWTRAQRAPTCWVMTPLTSGGVEAELDVCFSEDGARWEVLCLGDAPSGLWAAATRAIMALCSDAHVAPPHPLVAPRDLAHASLDDAQLDLVDEALQPMMRRLSERHGAPQAGYPLDDHNVVELELAWEDRRIGWLLDEPDARTTSVIEASGWQVVVASDQEVDHAERALDALLSQAKPGG